jgi:hypothetical protein
MEQVPAGPHPLELNPNGLNPNGLNPNGLNPSGLNPNGLNPNGLALSLTHRVWTRWANPTDLYRTLSNDSTSAPLFAMSALLQPGLSNKCVTPLTSPGQWVGGYDSFAESVLKGVPYNARALEFIRSNDYCPEDFRAVCFIRTGERDACRAHWNSALKIVCRNACSRANGEYGTPTPHQACLGLRARLVAYSVDRLADMSDPSSDSNSDSSSDSEQLPTPPKLVRQSAVNPELKNIHRLTLKAELDIARDTIRFKQMGFADSDCDTKWYKTLQELRHSGDLILPDKSHATFYHKSKQWYKTFKHKTLVDIMQRPLRFPIELLVNPNSSVIVWQPPVAPRAPASLHFRPITPPDSL